VNADALGKYRPVTLFVTGHTRLPAVVESLVRTGLRAPVALAVEGDVLPVICRALADAAEQRRNLPGDRMDDLRAMAEYEDLHTQLSEAAQ
jgi:hypothetical protein